MIAVDKQKNLFDFALDVKEGRKNASDFVDLFINHYGTANNIENELQLYKSVFDLLSVGVRIQNKKNGIFTVNKAYSKLSGKEESEIVGENCKHFICPKFCSNGECALNLVFSSGKELMTDFIVHNNTGNRFMHYEAIPIINSDGEINYVFETYSDVTEQVNTRGELQETQNLYFNILTAISDAVFIIK
ncbi:MAG: PAS domain-containing protein [Bacteroidales bacterium]|nr:PAS domain-containing protein [Bacteroidales bacterium]